MGLSQRTRRLVPLALLGTAGIALAGCGAPGAPNGGGTAVVTIYGTIVDDEARLMQQSWQEWADQNNIEIRYEGSQDFETQLGTRAQGGNPPDIAIFPQPGLLRDFAARD